MAYFVDEYTADRLEMLWQVGGPRAFSLASLVLAEEEDFYVTASEGERLTELMDSIDAFFETD